ncbi:MltR family transcriptional regulator [Ralstonia holmesii]|uniref:MltR family transcriptional regulator n=1 Tax=Ralstonia TaxID=48736 RepID=UPI0004680B29|nr:MltR family transcriptional regulator [Ralstonia pickettii]
MTDNLDTEEGPVSQPMDALDALLQEEEQRSGRRALNDKLTEEELHAFYDQSSERAMAVLLGAIVENHLTSLLRLYMRRDEKIARELFQPSGPLGPFGTKIRLAYMLRIIGPELQRDLTAVSKIRNVFAHDLTVVKFDSDPVRSWIQSMHMYDMVKNMAAKAQSRLDGGTSTDHIRDSIASDFMSSVTDAYRACLRFLIHWIVDKETAIVEAEKRMNEGK